MPRDPKGQLVERELLTLPVWDQFDAATADAVARAVERCLPEPWAFIQTAWRECGGQKRHVAFFNWNEDVFALIPGGDVTLGYDPALPYIPPPDLLAVWQRDARIYSEDPDFDWGKYLVEIMSPVRRVALGPFLIAVRGKPKGRETGADERTRVREEGFTLPSADQWEYACSAGTRSLWHWGDDPRDGPTGANAFGLWMAHHTYDQEALDTPGDYRGGDGGVREHGGSNELEAALPRASWFRSPADPGLEDWWHSTLYRRVLVLPPEVLD